MTPHQKQELETLYRKAVSLRVNPAGGPGLCEMRCSRLGCFAHHVVFRSQEPALRLKYEPRFGVWLCRGCHEQAHHTPKLFEATMMELFRRVNPPRAKCLLRLIETHDRVQAKSVSFRWMRDYLNRRIVAIEKQWADMYV
jgi:hypothetical protein